MTMTHVAMPKTGRGTDGGCGCGCGETPNRCCGVECLVRPSFHCGQLLNDADLTAMVQWSRDRFALSRYREGWGVVCGLEVTCSAPEGARGGGCGCGCGDKSSTGPALWIRPGYAVDCCGNDLVVCEPLRVDLSAVCRPADDPCGDPCAPVVVIDRDKERIEKDGKDVLDIEGLVIPRSEIIVVDLALRYGERPMAGQRPMFGGRCAPTDACEPTRILECPSPVLTVRDGAAMKPDHPREEYEEGLRRQLVEMSRRIDRLLEVSDRETLARRISAWRSYSICFLADWVRAQDEKVTDDTRATLRQWMLLDWMTHVVRCECTTCRSDDGVPLARLLLWRKDGRTECCRPLAVESYAPWRRDLSRDCRPRSISRRDLTSMIGQREEDVHATLRRETIDMDRATILGDRESMERPVFSAGPDDRLHLRTVRDWNGDVRVLGIEIT